MYIFLVDLTTADKKQKGKIWAAPFTTYPYIVVLFNCFLSFFFFFNAAILWKLAKKKTTTNRNKLINNVLSNFSLIYYYHPPLFQTINIGTGALVNKDCSFYQVKDLRQKAPVVLSSADFCNVNPRTLLLLLSCNCYRNRCN